MSSSSSEWRFKERKVKKGRTTKARSSYVDHLFYDDIDDGDNDDTAITKKRCLCRKLPFVLLVFLLLSFTFFYLFRNENDAISTISYTLTSAQKSNVMVDETPSWKAEDMMMDMEPLKQEKELLVEPEWERANGVLYKKTTDALALHQAEQEMKTKNTNAGNEAMPSPRPPPEDDEKKLRRRR
mmetsp:Transcript_11998/g.17482  ORF Transcript_11998/g.17482 Transcript_11998/m.17482 type:complete len:183 (+) Transcript_11998:63-611(+)|eukprot:234374-Ditylum_brightwellii.AAC.1